MNTKLDLTKRSITGLWVGDCIGNIGQLYFAHDILKALDEGVARFGDDINPSGQHFLQKKLTNHMKWSIVIQILRNQ